MICTSNKNLGNLPKVVLGGMCILYAHTKKDLITGEVLSIDNWQVLDEHLWGVASLAERFAQEFGASALGETAGLLHDIGKAVEEFQLRLQGEKISVDHKTEGARQALKRYGKVWGKVLAYVICGHHGGLPDDISVNGRSGLQEMLCRPSGRILQPIPQLRQNIQPVLAKPQSELHQSFYLTMFIRMLFSSLVDADYLDTEQFMQPHKAAYRGAFLPLASYPALFAPKLKQLLQQPGGQKRQNDGTVNQSRREVLTACLAAAKLDKGFYTLTVPTGGGKTLSSLAFALAHAEKHKMKRIIYAIPFTSITEQTAQVYRDIFGEDQILEHHSNIEVKEEDSGFNINRLASENWDASLIVTTNVQLFESLFAARPTRARKIHNLANSIIILDEAQTLPDHLLLPSLAALKSLCTDFGATVVFCTATQPYLKSQWLDGLIPREIIQAPTQLFETLKRTEIVQLGRISTSELAEKLRKHHQVLCIVNTRSQAKEIYALIEEEEEAFHLSAVMCPEHRAQIILEIKQRLQQQKRCLVVSTQLIEAGVDIDFPTVYRAAAGMDSIAQAAGRCNREGKMCDAAGRSILGKVYIFVPEEGLPQGWFSRMAALGEETLAKYADPLNPEAIRYFFQLRYGLNAELDLHQIMSKIFVGARNLSFSFQEIEQNYQLIEENTLGIIIPYDEKCRNLLAKARNSPFPAQYLRSLQRYSVSIYTYEFRELENRGYVQEFAPGMLVLAVSELEFSQVYSPKTGLSSNPEMGILMV